MKWRALGGGQSVETTKRESSGIGRGVREGGWTRDAGAGALGLLKGTYPTIVNATAPAAATPMPTVVAMS